MEHKTKENKTLVEDSRSHHDRLLREERLFIEKHNELIADEDPEGEFMESLHVKYTHITNGRDLIHLLDTEMFDKVVIYNTKHQNKNRLTNFLKDEHFCAGNGSEDRIMIENYTTIIPGFNQDEDDSDYSIPQFIFVLYSGGMDMSDEDLSRYAVTENTTLIISNLAINTSIVSPSDNIRDVFMSRVDEDDGETIVNISLINYSKGVAVVVMKSRTDAEKVIQLYNKLPLNGNILDIEMKPLPSLVKVIMPNQGGGGGGGGSLFESK